MDPLKHQPLSASSSKEENQSSKHKRFILKQLYRKDLKQPRGGPEKQQQLCVCVCGEPRSSSSVDKTCFLSVLGRRKQQAVSSANL